MLLFSNYGSRFFILFCLTLLASCGSSAVKERAAELEIAQQASQAGDYLLAATEYLKLAEATPALLKDGTPSTQKTTFQIAAAESYVKSGDNLNARKIIAQINPAAVDSSTEVRYQLVQAKIAELDQQPEQLLQHLQLIDLNAISGERRQEILQMQIRAYDEQNQVLDAARARVLIDRSLKPGIEQQDNRRTIWAVVQQQALTKPSLTTDDPLTSWFELRQLSQSSLFDLQSFRHEIEQWRQRYPNHAAEDPIIVELLKKSEKLGKKVHQIALLLPQTGRFAQAGAAVRDGFFSSWYDDNNQQDQPRVQVYAANPQNILDAYQRAVEEGADLIVGPLEKEAIIKLLSQPDLAVPTLVLNQLSSTDQARFMAHIASDQFFQFGLSPEHEAEQIAEKAWTKGYTRSLAITPNSSWGERLYKAFKNRFEELGGIILKHQQFEIAGANFSQSVINLLNIDSSEARYQQLTKTVNRKIKFTPRSRQDMDFIFMVSRPEQARQIRPQLLFHRSSNTLVLSTSHTYGLPPRGEPDLDLEGVIVADMPWMIAHQATATDSPLSLQQNWPEDQAAFLRLFALGRDAYRLIPDLARLRLQPDQRLQGDTGILRIDEKAQVRRDLSWAQFINGRPVLIPQPLKSAHNETQRSTHQ